MTNLAQNKDYSQLEVEGHFVAEEQPEELATQLLSFFTQTR